MRQFNVSSQKEAALKQKMADLQIFESDLEEQFIHSGGNGGKNENALNALKKKYYPINAFNPKKKLNAAQILVFPDAKQSV